MDKKKTIHIFDTTLRDGSQAEKINFTVEDKLLLAQRFDEFGVDYIEGGWPGSNPKDIEFFKRAKKIRWKHAKITAFGSTRYHKFKPKDDPNLKALVEAETPACVIFGKTWDLHVTEALKISLEKNLEMISDSVAYLKSQGREVIYDAEHFFDGYKANPSYALETLKAAEAGGADHLCLCDTNGGTLPHEISEIIANIRDKISTPFGIHAHNDSGCAVANSLNAVMSGASMVQGTMNGFGERCGNANLCAIMPSLLFKTSHSFFAGKSISKLTELSRFVFEVANLPHDERLPYTGESAFAHKGGIHVSAVQKNSRTYEHITPESVGNRRRVLISELAGKSNIVYKLQELGISEKSLGDETVKQIVSHIKKLENEGFEFENANASFELIIRKVTGKYSPVFDMRHFRLIIERTENNAIISEGVVKIAVKDREEYVVATGNGPVNAIDGALRKALEKQYPQIRGMQLVDYKVRVLGQKSGTDSLVRVLIESKKGDKTWMTVGVSANIIEASLQALIDSIEYMLLKKY